MSQTKEFLRGKGMLSFLILYMYLLVMLILHNSLNASATSKLFLLFIAAAAFLITFLILYSCRNLTPFMLLTCRDASTVKERAAVQELFCGLCFIFLFTLFTCIFADTDRFQSFQEMDFRFLLQSLFFAAAVSYLACVLYHRGSAPAFLLGLCLWIFLHLFVNGKTVFQDNSLVLASLTVILMAYYIQIILSHGKWLQNTFHIALYFLTSTFCLCTVRLAFLFVIPLALTAVFYTVRDGKKRLTFGTLILVAAVMVCTVSAFARREEASQRISDTLGFHLSIWCNIMYAYPTALPQEMQELLYNMIPQEVYDNYDYESGFYSISDSELIDYDSLARLSFTDTLKYTYQCFHYAPSVTLGAVAHTTCGLWKIASGTHGLELFTLLVVAVVLLVQNQCSAAHICPLFLYSYGSMLCLGGPRPDLYFFITPLWPAVLFLMLQDKTKFNIAFRQERTDIVR